jgi:4-amino-4-deoxy-L-arabinose transferase-like glycosyltransferase
VTDQAPVQTSSPAATPVRISWLALVGVCALAAAVRIAWDLNIHALMMSDFQYYFQKAVSIATGHGYTNGPYPTAFWPPGYSLFLAGVMKAFGLTVGVARASSVALWVVSTALAYLLGLRLGGRWTALLAGLIVALFPDLVFFANLTASENLFVPLLLGALLALSPEQSMTAPPTWKRAATAGLLLGLATVVRPTAVLLPAVIVLVLVAWYRSRPALVASVALLIAFALPTGALLARNAVEMHAPVLSTSGGFSLWLGNNANATGGYRVRGGYPNIPMNSPSEEVSANAWFTKQAVTWVVGHPGGFLALVPAKFQRLFDAPTSLGWNTIDTVKSPKGYTQYRKFTRTERRILGWVTRLKMDTALWMEVLCVFGVVGAIIAVAQRRTVGIWLAVLMGYWLLFHVTLANGQPRFLVSVAPAVAVAAAWAVVAGVGFVAKASGGRRAS